MHRKLGARRGVIYDALWVLASEGGLGKKMVSERSANGSLATEEQAS